MHSLTNNPEILFNLDIPEDAIGFKLACVKNREIALERNGKNPSKNSFGISKKETTSYLLADNVVIFGEGMEHIDELTQLYCKKAFLADIKPQQKNFHFNLNGCNTLVFSNADFSQSKSIQIVGTGKPLTIINNGSSLPKNMTFKNIPEIIFKGEAKDFDCLAKITIDKDTKVKGLQLEIDLGINVDNVHHLILQKATERQNTL